MLVHTVSLSQYPLLRRGKVRDVFETSDCLLMVATDRISAFDVVMQEAVPDKGAMLTQMSAFWFNKLASVVPNHLITTSLNGVPNLTAAEQMMLQGRTMVVRKANPFPIECVVRGYLAGSGWKEYTANGTVCGIPLPSGLQESQQLPEPIFTPATKAETGHDENISFDEAAAVIGSEHATQLRTISIELYNRGAEYARSKGLILADTKFEFGTNTEGSVMLIDEALTPDSSRYWLESDYEPGIAQHNFDKQILRDYLESTAWNKQAPAPSLPDHVIAATRERYATAMLKLTGLSIDTLGTTQH